MVEERFQVWNSRVGRGLGVFVAYVFAVFAVLGEELWYQGGDDKSSAQGHPARVEETHLCNL